MTVLPLDICHQWGGRASGDGAHTACSHMQLHGIEEDPACFFKYCPEPSCATKTVSEFPFISWGIVHLFKLAVKVWVPCNLGLPCLNWRVSKFIKFYSFTTLSLHNHCYNYDNLFPLKRVCLLLYMRTLYHCCLLEMEPSLQLGMHNLKFLYRLIPDVHKLIDGC